MQWSQCGFLSIYVITNIKEHSTHCDIDVCLFIFSSIYLFYKPFILYYKIEELKMLFVELNIKLQE